MEDIHREWIIPALAREIVKGNKFLIELSSNEMMQIGEQIVTNEANNQIANMVLDGKIPTPDQIAQFKQVAKETFTKQGNKKFVEILKGEMTGDNLSVSMNIAGKQRNLALLTDKLVNYVRQIIATPQMLQDPGIVNHVNEILEFSGLSPIKSVTPMLPAQGGTTDALKSMTQPA
jgi:hypothetical protein